MSSIDYSLFATASREKFRFPSDRGQLTIENLWDIPLTSLDGFSVDAIAIGVNHELKSLEQESFVGNGRNPGRELLAQKLEILKSIISIRQEEASKAQDAKERSQRKEQIRGIIERKQLQGLEDASLDELQKLYGDL